MSTTTNLPTKAVETQPAELSKELQSRLDNLLITIPKPRQLSWLMLSDRKLQIEQTMTKEELDMQALLTGYETKDAVKLQEAITEYEKRLKKLEGMRISVTKHTNQIGLDLMKIEKRAAGILYVENGRSLWAPDPEHLLVKAKEHLLKTKEEESNKVDAATAKATELAEFKKHVSNEHVRIRTAYELALKKTIVDGYTLALKDELEEEGVKRFVEVTIDALKAVKVGEAVKFKTKLYDKTVKDDLDQLIAAANAIKAPDYKVILARYIKEANEQFTLYFSDKANAEKAADFIKEQARLHEANVNDKAKQAMAVNELTAKNIGPVVAGQPGLKPIQRKQVIVIKSNDPQWAKKIVAEFLARFDLLSPDLRVTKWENLTVKQMAVALQTIEELIPGLEYEEIKK